MQQQPVLPASNHSIDEVDMEAGSDEERTPASRKRRGVGSHGGSSSDDEDTEAALLGGASSRCSYASARTCACAQGRRLTPRLVLVCRVQCALLLHVQA
jgi:hypothetical protein